MGRIHDRMPMTIARERLGRLARSGDGRRTRSARSWPLRSSMRLEAYPVSTLVNSVRNNGPELLEPLAAAATCRRAS